MRAIEFIASLGPKGVRLDGLRGTGGPVIGRDEVLDALAAVTEPVGQALLLTAARADDRSQGLLLRREALGELGREYERRIDVMNSAIKAARRRQIERLATARQVQPHWLQCDADPAVAHARSRLWPEWERGADRYLALVPAVITELTMAPSVCTTCRGERTVRAPIGEGRVACPKCAGTGLHPKNPRERGEALGVSRVAYVKAWAGPYEHLLGHLADRMQAAAGEFDRRIRANVRDAAA